MRDVTFITGNQHKADYLSDCLGYKLKHTKIDLEEIQSLDPATVVAHKVKQAFNILGKPVLVDDASLEFCCMGRLPGTFIKWYMEEMSLDALCRLVDGKDRSAIARGSFGYYDGRNLKLFAGMLKGTIAEAPRGTNGFGWGAIFIPEGQSLTRAEMDHHSYLETHKIIRPIAELHQFLEIA